MENRILLSQNPTTDISTLKGKVISYLTLHLGAKSDLTSCILKFFNPDRPDNESAWLKLVKPGFNASQILVPDQDACFFIMEYQLCMLTDIFGTPIESDGFTLHLTEIAT